MIPSERIFSASKILLVSSLCISTAKVSNASETCDAMYVAVESPPILILPRNSTKLLGAP